MRIHCPASAFDNLVSALAALDNDDEGAVEAAAELAREYDRSIGDLTSYQRAMVQVAAGSGCAKQRRAAARAGFRSIARAVLKMHKKAALMEEI